MVQPKWHTEKRDLQVGDVVMMQDSNTVRGEWKMAVVCEAIRSSDNRVRRGIIEYKSENGTRIRVERPVQRLIVLVPATN